AAERGAGHLVRRGRPRRGGVPWPRPTRRPDLAAYHLLGPGHAAAVDRRCRRRRDDRRLDPPAPLARRRLTAHRHRHKPLREPDMKIASTILLPLLLALPLAAQAAPPGTDIGKEISQEMAEARLEMRTEMAKAREELRTGNLELDDDSLRFSGKDDKRG